MEVILFQERKPNCIPRQFLSQRDTKTSLDNTPEEHKELDKLGKYKKKIWVTGFVRLQPYGSNNELRKPIYVEPHSSYAWVNEGFSLTKIVE